MADQQTPETWMAMKNLRLITNPITLKLRQRNAYDTCAAIRLSRKVISATTLPHTLLGELRMLPQTLVSWGGGYPLRIANPARC